ncbi:unnamed protein product [Closterium sp. NIES-54]
MPWYAGLDSVSPSLFTGAIRLPCLMRSLDRTHEPSTAAAIAWSPHVLVVRVWLDILIGMARGLEYLHSCGIVHHDIKSANILLDSNMEPKIADFGLVRHGEGTSVIATRVMGTPGYVEPDYYKPQKATPKADLHSY